MMNLKSIKHNKTLFQAIIFLLMAIGITLFAHWEPSGETWGYWFFSRIFTETGKFIAPDRSPLYTLYLFLFRWMDYPLSVTAEYVVTTFVTLLSLIVLFRRYLRMKFLLLAVILWIPFLQISEPPVLKLALACSCFAVFLRENKPNRFKYACSYALLIFAYMFRGTYLFCLLAFVALDIVRTFKHKKSLRRFLPQYYDLVILIPILFLCWFHQSPSPHRWNTASVCSADWLPFDAKSLTSGAFIQNYNSAYILDKYGSFHGKDLYFTNQELFKGAKTLSGAIKANPKFVVKQMLRNVKRALIISIKFTLIPALLYPMIPQGHFAWYPVHLFITIPIAFFVLYGAWKGAKTADMKCFMLANILMVVTLILVIPKERYMHSLLPVLILSASWYNLRLQNFLENLKKRFSMKRKVFSVLRLSAGYLLIFLFSSGAVDWKTVFSDLLKDVKAGDVRVLENRPYSMKRAKPFLDPLLQDCHGILALEHRFLATFTKLSVEKFYDISEIPPFGTYGDYRYEGLRPQRINCVLTSYDLINYGETETNVPIRYKNYIKPYVKQLERQGAVTKEIPSYGFVTILKNK